MLPNHRRERKQAGFSVQHQPSICLVCGGATGCKHIVNKYLRGKVITVNDHLVTSLIRNALSPFCGSFLCCSTLEDPQGDARGAKLNQ